MSARHRYHCTCYWCRWQREAARPRPVTPEQQPAEPETKTGEQT